MIRKTFVMLLALTSILASGQDNVKKEPVDWVDPMIGTATSRWMLFPGASLPFGMVKLSPDNQELGWKAGYEYDIGNIAGFSHIHSWVMGGLLCMPASGELKIVPGPEDNGDVFIGVTLFRDQFLYLVTYELRFLVVAFEEKGHDLLMERLSPENLLGIRDGRPTGISAAVQLDLFRFPRFQTKKEVFHVL